MEKYGSVEPDKQSINLEWPYGKILHLELLMGRFYTSIICQVNCIKIEGFTHINCPDITYLCDIYKGRFYTSHNHQCKTSLTGATIYM